MGQLLSMTTPSTSTVGYSRARWLRALSWCPIVLTWTLIALPIVFVCAWANAVIARYALDHSRIWPQPDHAWWMGFLGAAAVVTGYFVVGWRLSDRLMAGSIGCHDIDPLTDPKLGERLRGALARLCERCTLPNVHAHIIDDDMLNAVSFGTSRHRAHIAVSTGLLQGLSDTELDAILLYHLSRIAHGDARMWSVLCTTTLLPLLIYDRASTFLTRDAPRYSNAGSKERKHPVKLAVASVLVVLLYLPASVMAVCVYLSASRGRVYAADREVAIAIGSEPMVSALQRMALGVQARRLLRAVGPLFTIDPNRQGVTWHEVDLFIRAHPALRKRARKMRREMTPDRDRT
ncbi:MAG: M48 family metalloprotease [Phycisphaera sp.]|nr:M48 family metalloprotease [Phycisphaera sp.]